jgi:pimeloyl-ACP methyl ester carboxylesterase
MREEPCQFGPANALFGVITQPEAAADNKKGVLLITAGLLHRSGPYRLYVHLARKLALQGYTTLRFDLGGIGDSDIVSQCGNAVERSVTDIQAAIDYLETSCSVSQHVVIGLCSGADDAFRAATADTRISGCILIDGMGYRTAGYYARHFLLHYPRRLISPHKWKNLTRRYLWNRQSVADGDVDYREFPSREKTRRNLETLVAHHCRLGFIYTGGVSDYYNYENQFKTVFPAAVASSCVDVVYFPRMDHMAILQTDRSRLLETIVQWMNTMDCDSVNKI